MHKLSGCTPVSSNKQLIYTPILMKMKWINFKLVHPQKNAVLVYMNETTELTCPHMAEQD